MEPFISVIIPNYNGARTLAHCLEAALSQDYGRFEVVVVDDCSQDDSSLIAERFPCRLVKLREHAGAAKARNAGVLHSSGELLFFTDADCILERDTLSRASLSITGRESSAVGGTYTWIPYDDTFFSTFQSIFVHYSETKSPVPDYLATHALVITRELFEMAGGFPEDFLPILEDVEFSHRLRRSGHPLVMDAGILVRHIFHFSIGKSLRNAFRKSLFWTEYSLGNRDVFADSGTASRELKMNVVSFFLSLLLLFVAGFSGETVLLIVPLLILMLNLYVSRGLIVSFFGRKGLPFGLAASLYYAAVYPMAVGAGALLGSLRFLRSGDQR